MVGLGGEAICIRQSLDLKAVSGAPKMTFRDPDILARDEVQAVWSLERHRVHVVQQHRVVRVDPETSRRFFQYEALRRNTPERFA